MMQPAISVTSVTGVLLPYVKSDKWLIKGTPIKAPKSFIVEMFAFLLSFIKSNESRNSKSEKKTTYCANLAKKNALAKRMTFGRSQAFQKLIALLSSSSSNSTSYPDN